MTALALLIISAHDAKSMIAMAPNQSAFYVPPNRQDNSPLVVESVPNQAPGILLLRERQFEDGIYEYALKDLYGTKVTAIVRKTSEGALEYWNMNGKPLSAREVDIPPKTRESLKPGYISFAISQPVDRYSIENPDHLFLTPGQVSNPAFDHDDTWVSIAVPDIPAVDVGIQIQANYVVSQLDPQPGSWIEFEGLRFEVVDNQKRTGDENESRRVLRSGTLLPNRDYSLRVRLNGAKYRKDFPSEDRPILRSWERATEPTHPATQLSYVTADQPSKYWGAIVIKRKLTLHGYVENLPTKPRGAK